MNRILAIPSPTSDSPLLSGLDLARPPIGSAGAEHGRSFGPTWLALTTFTWAILSGLSPVQAETTHEPADHALAVPRAAIEQVQQNMAQARAEVAKAQEQARQGLAQVRAGVASAQEQVHVNLARARAEVARAHKLTQLAQATSRAGAGPAAVQVLGDVPEPPEPPEPPEAPEGVGEVVANALAQAADAVGGVRNALSPSANRTGASTMVVATKDNDPKGLAETQEDLAIMARILAKGVGRRSAADHQAMNDVFMFDPMSESRQNRALYLEGYGAVFFLNVRYPLVAVPEAAETKAEKPVDSTWEEAKQEIYGRGDNRPGAWLWPRVEVVRSRETPKFDPDQVEKLKTSLLEALKNATHLRRVQADESVMVVVTGGGASRRAERLARASNSTGGRAVAAVAVDNAGSTDTRTQSMLILKVKKADADAFAKGDLTLDAFRKTATIAAY